MNRFSAQLSWLDHLLVYIGCLAAVFSMGMSVGSIAIASFFAAGVTASALIGFLLAQMLRGSKVVQIDGYLWALIALGAFSQVRTLNDVLPDGGLPFRIVIAAYLAWMIVLCGVVSWSDQTLLFLSLPCIALFGLVGTFDTFDAGIPLFFVFLLTTAVLYARAHQRSMMEEAKVRDERGLSRLRRDAWRWMAGPEWALASAGVIIGIAIVAAPILRFSLQGVSGQVSVTPPNLTTGTTPSGQPNEGGGNETPEQYEVGQGPIRELSEEPVLQVGMDLRRLMRANTYSYYTGSGWNSQFLSGRVEELPAFFPEPILRTEFWDELPVQVGWEEPGPPLEPVANGENVLIELTRLQGSMAYLPTPAPVVAGVGRGRVPEFTFRVDGDAFLRSNVAAGNSVSYYSRVPDGRPVDAVSRPSNRYLREIADFYTDRSNVSPRVASLAREVTEDLDTDYEKAEAITREVGSRIVYNLQAGAIPEDANAVEHALFESNEGYCDLFASSVAVMAREAGLMSRYVTGWLLADSDLTDDGEFIVREKDFHAWAEIYFDGYGWVPFDATEYAQEIEGAGRGSVPQPPVPWYQSDQFRTALTVGVPGLLVAGAVLWLVAGRARKRDSRPSRINADALQLHRTFQKSIEHKTKLPRRFSQTTREYVEAHRELLGACKGEALNLTAELETVLFAKASPPREKLNELEERIKQFRRDLKKVESPDS
ncbi:MAG: transglutaminase-like domain-containing protein [Fimbriimonadaceae bacterium]